MTITTIHDCRIDNLPFIMGCEYEAEPFLNPGRRCMDYIVHTIWGFTVMSLGEVRKHFIGI